MTSTMGGLPFDLGAEIAAESVLAVLLGLVIFSGLASCIFYGIAWLRKPGYFKSEEFQRRCEELATLKTPLDVWRHR
jgi:hypothetical protein